MLRPQHSTLLNLGEAIKGHGFSAGMVGRWFNKLVEKEDYEESDRRAVLKHLVALSCPEDDKKQGVKGPERGAKVAI